MVSTGKSQVAIASVRVPLAAPVHDSDSVSKVQVGLGSGVWVLTGDCVGCTEGAGEVVAVGLGCTFPEAHPARNTAVTAATIPVNASR